MPSVGTRRSTRVFVPKSVKSSPDAGAARVLRSGKRLSADAATTRVDDREWLTLFGSPAALKAVDFPRVKKGSGLTKTTKAEHDLVGSDRSGDVGEHNAQGDELPVPPSGNNRLDKMFGIVYSRKRRIRDPKYGIKFGRKRQKRKKVFSQPNKDYGLWANRSFNNCFPSGASVLVFVEFSCSSLSRFASFIISVLRWMRKSRFRSLEFTAFLLSEPIFRAFSQNGIHFVVDSLAQNRLFCRHPRGEVGICTVFGASQFIPLVSFNFSALPWYFKRLHVDMLLRSFCVSCAFVNHLMSTSQIIGENEIMHDEKWGMSVKMNAQKSESSVSGSPSMARIVVDLTEEATIPGREERPHRSSRYRKHKKRRSSARYTNAQNHQVAGHQNGKVGLEFESLARLPSVANGLVMPTYGSPKGALNSFGRIYDYAALSSPRTNLRPKKSLRYNSAEKIKELKSFLGDLKQNMDSVRCNANILVIESDKCWREEGVKVMLEKSGSKEWCLAVKMHGLTRFLYKAQEVRSGILSTSNRFTHAMIWTGENGWRLEFCDREDWLLFRELYRECCDRNSKVSLVRMIPVPVVREIIGYEDDEYIPFVRPDVYISVVNDEVQRALVSESAFYDMDSGDEKLLEQLNTTCDARESDCLTNMSKDDFERIIYLFERAAYSHPDDVSDESKAISLCVDLGRPEMISAIYRYWQKKRKQKKSSLVRIFQAPPPRRAQFEYKPVFRKRRSFKRQASQVGRRPEPLLQADAKEGMLQRVQEAQQAARRAVDFAVLKRTRAQMVAQNADLLLHKSLMALRMAEAAHVAESHDASTSSVHDFFL